MLPFSDSVKFVRSAINSSMHVCTDGLLNGSELQQWQANNSSLSGHPVDFKTDKRLKFNSNTDIILLEFDNGCLDDVGVSESQYENGSFNVNNSHNIIPKL